MESSTLRNAAIVLISLGPKVSGEILKRLPDSLVEKLTGEIATLRRVEPEDRRAAFRELYEFRKTSSLFSLGGEDFAKEMLESALGSHRASKMIHQATGFGDDTNFDMLKKVDPLTVSNFLKVESAQTAALVLAHMDPRHSGPILSLLPSVMQAEVSYRMAVMDKPNPEFVREVEATLAKQVKGEHEQGGRTYGGKKQVAELLNEIEQDVWTEILEEMREIDEETALDVKNLMFVFEDIVTLDERYVQEFLKEIDSKELTMALKAASEEVKDRIFSNMSKRAALGIQEDMEYMGPVKLADVEEAQQRVVDVIRRLEEEGTIVLGGGKGGDLVV